MSCLPTSRPVGATANMIAESLATSPFGVVEAVLLSTGVEGAESCKKILATSNTALFVAELGLSLLAFEPELVTILL